MLTHNILTCPYNQVAFYWMQSCASDRESLTLLKNENEKLGGEQEGGGHRSKCKSRGEENRTEPLKSLIAAAVTEFMTTSLEV